MNPVDGYTLIVNSDRIIAQDRDGIEICGAYQPVGHEYWSLYLTKLVSELTGMATPPHREHFYGCQGRVVAKAWVELLASLYSLAVQRERERVA